MAQPILWPFPDTLLEPSDKEAVITFLLLLEAPPWVKAAHLRRWGKYVGRYVGRGDFARVDPGPLRGRT